MDDKLRDIIVANSLDELPAESSFAKDRIVGYMETMSKENPKFWMSRKTIATESKVSAVYTCNVLDKLLQEQRIEKGMVGRKAYYRLVEDNG